MRDAMLQDADDARYLSQWGTPPNDNHNAHLTTLTRPALHACAMRTIPLPYYIDNPARPNTRARRVRGSARKAVQYRSQAQPDAKLNSTATTALEEQATECILQLTALDWTAEEINALHDNSLADNVRNLRAAIAYATAHS